MPGRSFRIAKIAGIPVGISPWWLAIVALITWSLGAGYYPNEAPGITRAASYGLGFASAMLLFASILAHEFGHALVARRRGLVVEEIDLWLLGGVARMSGRPERARDELQFALAGPMVTAVIAAVFGALAVLLHDAMSAELRAIIVYQAEVNLMIFVFNLMPAFPLDGGRVLRALLWRRGGDIIRATNTASRFGRAFGIGLIAFGFLIAFSGYLGGLWLVLIGIFLMAASGAERLQQEVVTTFTGVRAEELMSQPVVSIRAGLPLAVVSEGYFARYRYTSFPVVDSGGRALGLLSIDRVERASGRERTDALVGDLTDRDPGLIVDRDADVADLLGRPAFARMGRAVVVDESQEPIGIVSVTDVQRVVRAAHLLNRDRRSVGLTPR